MNEYLRRAGSWVLACHGVALAKPVTHYICSRFDTVARGGPGRTGIEPRRSAGVADQGVCRSCLSNPDLLNRGLTDRGCVRYCLCCRTSSCSDLRLEERRRRQSLPKAVGRSSREGRGEDSFSLLHFSCLRISVSVRFVYARAVQCAFWHASERYGLGEPGAKAKKGQGT